MFPDGLKLLCQRLPLTEIMRLIEHTARWVAPETFRLLPLWFPEHARGAPFYKENWHEKQTNTNRRNGISQHKHESNRYANMALTQALGLRTHERTNWSCCHIWGVDDPFYQKGNLVVQDRRFYSCVGNMLLLPTPLKAFTDVMPEVKAMLRICARNLYGWRCDHGSLSDVLMHIDAWKEWSAYPSSWPRGPGGPLPLGTVPLDDGIRNKAMRRLATIKRDIASGGPYYPKTEVKEALAYWGIEI